MEFEDTAPLAPEAPESESRRRFVAQTGMAAAAVALSGTASLAQAAQFAQPSALAGQSLHVGMLLPEGRAYPQLGAQLLAGARAYAERSGGVQLHITPVFYGRHTGQAERAAQELLEKGPVDVLAGYVDPNAVAQWTPMLSERQVPLLVGDTGANALDPEARSPWIVHNNLGYWQAAWAAGRWSAKALGPRAIVAVGPADSGFDHLPAFERGFASAGGRVQATVLTRGADGTSRLDALARLVRQTRPDLVFALDSGPRTADFHRFWSHSGIANHVPLVVGGMLAEAMANGQSPGQQGMRVWTARPWQPQDDTGLKTVPEATPFHLLGQEMAQRIHAGATLSGARGLALAQAMAAAVLQTPRGEVRLDAVSGETLAVTYLQGLHTFPSPSAVTLPSAAASACQGLCDMLSSRVTGTYLAA
jgi:ABC-type branched-subunit amino acid transport system substrate-binding protein